jgi:putative endonuclease
MLTILPSATTDADNGWFLYIIESSQGMLYTGITTDVTRRLHQHQSGKGAKALRGKGELRIVFYCQAGSRAQASRLEWQVKQLSKKQKQQLITAFPNRLSEYLNNLPGKQSAQKADQPINTFPKKTS